MVKLIKMDMLGFLTSLPMTCNPLPSSTPRLPGGSGSGGQSGPAEARGVGGEGRGGASHRPPGASFSACSPQALLSFPGAATTEDSDWKQQKSTVSQFQRLEIRN